MAVNINWNPRRWWARGLWNPDKGKQSADGDRSPVSSSRAYVSDERALSVSAVFSCIRIISETVASLPLCVYERQANGTRREVHDHWLAGLLEKPNPLMTGQEYREAMTSALAGWGNSFSEKARNAKGRTIELWPLRPEGVVVDKTDRFTIRVTYHPTGDSRSEIPYEDGETLHVKGFGTDGIMGLSPMGLAREALGLAISAEDYASSYYANGGRPTGIMSSEKTLTPDQRVQARKEFTGIANEGAAAGNKLWLLEGPNFKYQSISIPPEDAQMLQTRQFQIAEIARYFRVPLFLLNEMEKSTSWGSGLEQQNLAFLAYTLRPYLIRIENSINRWIIPKDEQARYYVEHNVEGLLRADSAARASYYATMVQNGLMDRNEVRGRENFPLREGAGALTVQSNLLPIDLLGKPPAESVAPTKAPDSGAS